MSLTIGELTGFITLDDGEVAPALRRAEGELRSSGGRMASDADRAGQNAGDALGDGLRDGASDGAADAERAAGGAFSKIQMIAAGAGVAAGAVLMQGIATALDQSRITGRLQAQLGATPAVAKRYGKIAGAMYAAGVTEDFQGAADAISVTMRAGLLPTGATNSQIKSIATNISDLAGTFELDLGQAANAVGQIMKTGLAPNAKTALDIITKGMQQMGPRADDIADTFNEYSVIFQRLGLNAQTATGLMSQGMKAGARDTDVVADALKEFTIEGVQGSAKIVSGFKNIGLNSGQMVKMIAAGGPQATKALQMTLDKLRQMEDPVKRDAAATELFGTKSEDVQKALLALDPSKAVASLGTFSGAADKAGTALRDNAGTRIDAFKRGLQQGVVNVVGNQVLPVLMRFGAWAQQHSGTLQILAAVVAGVLVPALVLMGVTATISAARTVAGWVSSGASAIGSAATQVGSAARVVGAWVVMGVQSMIQGARMAAAWVVAMGPVGWVIAAIVGLAAIIFLNWDKIKSATAAAWNWIWGKIKGIGKSIISTISGFVYGALRAWDNLKFSIIMKVIQLAKYVSGLPAKIRGALGSLGSLLLEKGRNIVQGLWNGIKGMGSWIKGKLIGWAKDMIPGPIAKALGIHSPSKVTKEQGRWIARGLIDGLTGSASQVKSAAAKLAGMVTDGMKPGKKRSKALAKIRTDSKRLVALANKEAAIAGRLKTAQKKLSDQIAARDKLAADVKKGVLDSANITSGGDGPVSAASILANLTLKMKQAKQFAEQLATLKKRGVRSDLIAQIAQAGVEQGAASAAALATASTSQIAQINAVQGQLVTAAGKAGSVAGDAMYGAGINAAAGLVKGLRSQQKAIEKQMMTIALAMQKAIKKALGIHSPSRVMAALGQYIPQGLARGIDGGRGAVDRSMSALVDPSAVPIPTGSMAASDAQLGARSAGPTVIEIRSDGGRRAEWLLEELRQSISVRGGDVQIVLGGRRK
ncbi:phage tail tape measure protein [Streptomyces sp. NPDC050421]|uniref:phage tail tape measure protein n=1 Tax=Streptomyces sp. NPDC050421 TaxID=3365613 RepID=UPI003799BCC5